MNSCVHLTERQVLPRGIDHGVDLARLGALKSEDEEVFTLVLDFKDAFMFIPLRESEQRFNCAHTGFELSRARPALIDNEVASGNFVVWRTLGFGGRPTPLVCSRVASFAARTAQALLGQDTVEQHPSDVAPGRIQLYVDDPITSVKATEQAAQEAFDIVILWWLALGIPLSWKKGSLARGSETHRWIGIDYTLTDAGAVKR